MNARVAISAYPQRDFFFGYSASVAIPALTAIIVFFLISYPLLMLFIGSFSGARPSDDAALSLRTYALISNELPLLYNSLKVAVFSTLLALIFGVGPAWILARTNVPGAATLEQLVLVPFYLSALLGAVGWALLAAPSRAGLLNGWLMDLFNLQSAPINIYSEMGIIWVSGLHFAPFCFLFSLSALRSMEPALEDSARVLGGGTFSTMFRITLPLIMPALIGSGLLVFVLAVGQFGIPAILGLPRGYQVLTTRIYELIIGFSPDYALAATLGIALTLISSLGVWFQIKVLGTKSYATVSGKGYRPRLIDVGGFKWLLLGIMIAYVLIAVVLPVGAIIYASLLAFMTTNVFEAVFTLENYRYIIFDYPTTMVALRNTMFLAFTGSTITLVFALVLSWHIVRKKDALSKAVEFMAMVPVAVPGIVFSIGLLWAWIQVPLPIYGTIWILLLCYISIFFPYGVRAVSASMHQIDKNLEECASVCGAGWGRVMRDILLPLLKPGLMAAWTLLFISIVKELSASALLYNNRTVVLSVAVYDLWSGSSFPRVATLALIEAATIFLALWFARRATKSKLAL